MDWALHQTEVRFDIRAERAEYERLFRHQARVLQDRLARLGGGDRTKEIPVSEWQKVYQKEVQERRLLYQGRVLGWVRKKDTISRTNGTSNLNERYRLFT